MKHILDNHEERISRLERQHELIAAALREFSAALAVLTEAHGRLMAVLVEDS
jgi:hypothetical protein